MEGKNRVVPVPPLYANSQLAINEGQMDRTVRNASSKRISGIENKYFTRGGG